MLNALMGSEFVLVSDIHLRGPEDQRYLILCELIEAMFDVRPRYFILLGDIFDFFFGRKAYYANKYSRLGELLSALSAKGTKVIFFEGNHEFDLERTKWSGVDFVGEGNRVLNLSDAKTLKLAHGDLVYSNRAYRVFRGFIKSLFVRLSASLIPPSWLEAYALRHASVSRSQDHYRKLNHTALLSDAKNWIDDSHASFGIIGHFHTPYYEALDHAQLLSVYSWDQINFLAYKDGKFLRGYWQKKNWQVSEAIPTSFRQD